MKFLPREPLELINPTNFLGDKPGMRDPNLNSALFQVLKTDVLVQLQRGPGVFISHCPNTVLAKGLSCKCGTFSE